MPKERYWSEALFADGREVVIIHAPIAIMRDAPTDTHYVFIYTHCIASGPREPMRELFDRMDIRK